MAHCACNRDAQDAPGLRRSGSVKFLHCPGANRSPSRPATANRGLTALLKWADGQHCVAGAWRVHPDLVFVVVLARAVAPVSRLWRWTQCPLHIAIRVE